MDEPSLRIGELSRRTGLSEHVLRAWEARYGLLRPSRSAGGYRLYDAADERRARRMRELIASGLSAAEAAKSILAQRPPAPIAAQTGDAEAADVSRDAMVLRDALDEFDEPAAQAALDRLLSSLTVPAVLRDVVLPYLRELGERWADGSISVAQEHFASNVLRGRLAGLALGWGAGTGPRALLACPPGELHDLPLMIFGIALNRLGWRVTYLGGNTPLADLLDAVHATRPDVIVLAAVAARSLEDIEEALPELGRGHRLALAGIGADAALAERVGARLLASDPVSEAQGLAESF